MSIPDELKNYAFALGFPESKTMGRIFEILFEGEDVLKLIKAMPGTVAELAEKSGLPEERVERMTRELMMRGAIAGRMLTPEVYRLFPAMIELRDASILNPEAPQELFELWEHIITKELGAVVPIAKRMKVKPITRVVPIERSIEARNTVLAIDEARRIFKDADLITVLPCACRTQARKVGRGQDCPAPATSVCMQTNRFAQAVLSRDLGERITVEDALKRVGDAEDAGLVHMVRNNVKQDMFMCNCCSCCCTGIYTVRQYDFPEGISPSRFQVKLDPDLCSACGTCEDRCQFGAISIEETAVIDVDHCYGCGNCVITCPEEALTLVELRPKEHIRVT